MATILSDYIIGDEIYIPQDKWKQLNNEHDKDSIIVAFKAEILSGNIAMPLRKITYEDAESSFLALQNYRCTEHMGCMATRYDYEFDPLMNGLYLSESNVGNAASDYFQQRNRFACNSINAPSPERVWANEKFLDGMLKALWTLRCSSVDTKTLRTCLALRKYIASQFKPAIAKSLYEKFNSVNVLDFSAGWGDRLCGFYACEGTKKYIGIDPNSAVYNKYFEQVQMYERFNHKETVLINKPAEEVELPKECVDTVFTSPPYFNIERYSDEDTQSYKRYRKIEDWLSRFLFPVMDLSCAAMQKGGYLLINISDVYSGHKINHICDPMNYYLKSKKMKYQGVIGMQMAKRPNSRTIDKDRVFVEPIWVWRK